MRWRGGGEGGRRGWRGRGSGGELEGEGGKVGERIHINS